MILTQWFEPEPTFKGLLLARELAARGHDVQVLTGFPNYPSGTLYPGYRIRPWTRQVIDGVHVLRVPLYPSHDASGLHRVLNYASFALSAAVLGSWLVRRPDVMYVYHPPATTAFAAIVIGILRNVPFVYDVQDMWPDTLKATGMLANRHLLELIGKWCDLAYRRAEYIVVLSPGFRLKLIERGVPATKIGVIYNWCDEESVRVTGAVAPLSPAGRFSVLFAGSIGLAQDLQSVLRAARLCQTTVPSAEFIFVGDGVARKPLSALKDELRLANVRFLPHRPMHLMGNVFAGADVLLVHLKDDSLFRITIPSKTQAYLAAGKPILMAVRGDAADLIDFSRSGINCQPGDPHSIAAAVKQLAEAGDNRLAEMGQNARAFYDRELSVRVGVDRLEKILRESATGIKRVKSETTLPSRGV